MKILVPVKRVAALEDDFRISDDVLIKEAAAGEVQVIAATVGPEVCDEVLRACLAKGADRALRVWGDALAGSDPVAIARVLASVVRREEPDLVLAGAQSADHGHATTGIALSALLNWPHVAVVVGLKYGAGDARATATRELEGGMTQEVDLACPAVLTIQLGINKPRYASLRAIKQAAAKPIEVLGPDELGLASADVGEAGSASRVRRMLIAEKGSAQMIEGTAQQKAQRLAQIVREFRSEKRAA